jgi:hypothetical protein
VNQVASGHGPYSTRTTRESSSLVRASRSAVRWRPSWIGSRPVSPWSTGKTISRNRTTSPSSSSPLTSRRLPMDRMGGPDCCFRLPIWCARSPAMTRVFVQVSAAQRVREDELRQFPQANTGRISGGSGASRKDAIGVSPHEDHLGCVSFSVSIRMTGQNGRVCRSALLQRRNAPRPSRT